MKTLEESIAVAMDVQVTEIAPFLPYILQDFWEMGTPPKTVIDLVKKHCRNHSSLHILDLGCGKGAVSIQLAEALNCSCYGIDCVPEFIEAAIKKATDYGMEALCRFEVGDIREKIKELDKFDVIILGSIGPVFGDYYTTMTTLPQHLSDKGIIVVNDAYADGAASSHLPQNPIYNWVLPRQEMLKQIGQTGMELIDEFAGKYSEYSQSDKELENIVIRCSELKIKYPERSWLFEKYIHEQTGGYDALENDLTSSIMVVKRKTDI